MTRDRCCRPFTGRRATPLSRRGRQPRRSVASSVCHSRSCHRRRLRAGAGGDPGDARSGQPVTELTKQNIQARIRGQRMWNWSNSSGGLFLQTGNMSETGGRLHHHRGRSRRGAERSGQRPKTLVMALLDIFRDRQATKGSTSCWPSLRARAGAGSGGRAGVDALPGARRLFPPLRQPKSSSHKKSKRPWW